MINSFEQLVTYFRTLATEHTGVNDFVYGYSERIISRETSIINYPVVWLMPVEAAPVGGGEGPRYRYDFTLLILTNAAVDDWELEDANMFALEAVAKDFIGRIYYDAVANRQFIFELRNASLDPKHRHTGDNDHGWVIEGSLTTLGEYCYSPEKWNCNGH